MNRRDEEPIDVTPEVLPPDSGGRGGYRAGPTNGPGPNRMHLILIGLLLDALDALTWGPLGVRFGLVLGFLSAFALFTFAGIPLKRRILYSMCCGIYCLLPGTERVPLGTLLGAVLHLR